LSTVFGLKKTLSSAQWLCELDHIQEQAVFATQCRRPEVRFGSNEKTSPRAFLVCNTSVSRTHGGPFEGGDRTFPNGCHVVEVEIDEGTGAVEIVR